LAQWGHLYSAITSVEKVIALCPGRYDVSAKSCARSIRRTGE
jgi:hypothetical protein